MPNVDDVKTETNIIKCTVCEGRGKYKGSKLFCSTCKGTGRLKETKQYRYVKLECPFCQGTGKRKKNKWTGKSWPDGTHKEGTGSWIQEEVRCDEHKATKYMWINFYSNTEPSD